MKIIAKVLDHITGEIVKAQDSITAPYVKEAAQDGYDRLIKPAMFVKSVVN